MATIKQFQEQLDELIIIFYLVLERYKDSYPIYKSTSANDEKLYKESKSQLDGVFNDIFILESKITEVQAAQDKIIQTHDNSLGTLKKKFNVDTQKLGRARDTNLASYPLKFEYKYRRMIGYIGLIYYVVAILFLGLLMNQIRKSAFFHKFGKKNWQPINVNIKDARTLLPQKAAIILTIISSIISGCLAAYYG